MAVTCVFGMQWGDEGKGRVVDLLASASDVVVRFQGGANAGHTVVVPRTDDAGQVVEDKYVLHLLPSGAIQPTTLNVIGNGVVLDPWTLMREIDQLTERGIDLDGPPQDLRSRACRVAAPQADGRGAREASRR